MPETFPALWRDMPCYVVAIPRPLIPYIGGLMKILENRGFWSSEADYSSAYDAVLEFERCLMTTCLDDLLERQDRLYRMLDAALFGKEYTLVSADPLEVTPGIPAVHEMIYQTDFGIMAQIDDLRQLIDNSINGAATTNYAYPESVKDLLQGIIDALAADDADLESILSKLEIIAALVA